MPLNSSSRAPIRVAIDTGGTFTDCVWVERGRLKLLKLFSTPADPSLAIADAIMRIAGDAPTVLLHGTTVGTNAVLERKGARVAFVTTEGFEDTIEIGRQSRPKLYDLFFDRILPLVPAELRFGVPERVAQDGVILREPQPDDLKWLGKQVEGANAESVAVSLLFSFANTINERAVANSLSRLKIPISLSHEILPEFREYERASTVVMNAYLQPVLERYLKNLQKRVERSTVFVMQSSGGNASLATASREPVRTVLSGPAGGVIGGAAIGRKLGNGDLITLDMGGTSTDVALISGEPRPTTECEIAGLPVRAPMLDIHTVGAGGGSIARFDAGGALRIGPESAGADPGPICYGKGGQPTVTDANLLLGRLRPDEFLGGNFRLDVERTRDAVKSWLSKQKSAEARRMSLEKFAEGVIRVVNANMEKAVRVVSVERGYDPRSFILIAFGGAGPLHAAELASALSIPEVVIPAIPGALSAYGILVSDIVRDYSHTVLLRASNQRSASFARVQSAIAKLEQGAMEEFHREGWKRRPKFIPSVDVRYHGQGYELNVSFSANLLVDFHREHQKRYGYSHPERDVELVTVRVRAVVPSRMQVRQETGTLAPVKRFRDSVWFGDRYVKTLICRRETLGVNGIRGPAIITEYSATTVVPPGWSVGVLPTGNLVMRRQGTRRM